MIRVDQAFEMCSRTCGAVMHRLHAMPKLLCYQVNPKNPRLAQNELRDWVERLKAEIRDWIEKEEG